MNIREKLRGIVRLHGSPEAIARGVLIGLFVTFSPTVGFHILLCVILASLCGASRAAALIPLILSSPVTIVPLYAFTYYLGQFLWHGPSPGEVRASLGVAVQRLGQHNLFDLREQFEEFLQLGADIWVPMLIGGLILSTASAAVCYPLTLTAARRYRKAAAGNAPG
jgi:uncharacterized protein